MTELTNEVVVPLPNGVPEAPGEHAQKEAPEISDTTASVPENGNLGDIAASAPLKRRRDPSLVAKEEKGRNKRMFGMLLTSLGKFQEETTKSKALSRRTEIEKKILENKQRDWQEHELREQVDRTKQRQEDNFRRLKQRLIEESEARRSHASMLKTVSKPNVFYKPSTLLADQKTIVEAQEAEAEVIIKGKWETFYAEYPADFVEHMKNIDDKAAEAKEAISEPRDVGGPSTKASDDTKQNEEDKSNSGHSTELLVPLTTGEFVAHNDKPTENGHSNDSTESVNVVRDEAD